MRMATPTIDGLVLGVKVARAMKDKAAEDSYMQQLRRRYPDSPQTAELERRQ
jgi:type IV pilus assembly protein PilF